MHQAGSPLDGKHVFADYVNGRVGAIAADGTPKAITDATELTALLDAGAGGPLGNISSFGEGANGELFIVDFASKVVQVVPEPASAAQLVAGALMLWYRHARRA